MLMNDKNKCLKKHPDFTYDEACLDVFNWLKSPVDVYGQYVECHKCQDQFLGTVPPLGNHSVLIDTKYALSMQVMQNNVSACKWKQDFLEHYRYVWNLTDLNKCKKPFIVEEADNAYLPILTAFIIFFFFGTFWYMVKCIYKCTRNNIFWRRVMRWNVDVDNDLGSAPDAPLVVESAPKIRKHPNRIKSLDIFRGFCILVMIFVNYGGGQYWFFQHSLWNGLTVADIVFPWFLWLMGLSLSVSFYAKLRTAVPRRQLVFMVIRRSFLLFMIGIIIESHYHSDHLSTLRVTGVLQRIAVCYLIVGLLEATFAQRSYEAVDEERCGFAQDLIQTWPQHFIMCVVLTTHILLTFLVEVPGCGKGYIGPGGLDDEGKYWNCTGGLAGYIDRKVLGNHMYQKGMDYAKIYESAQHFDPEGILGTLTSAYMVYLGVQAGSILRIYTNLRSRIVRWLTLAFAYMLVGALLCNFSKEDGIIPINKRMWSVSFIFLLSGMAYLIFTVLFVLVDVTKKWGGRPFFYPGMNPLLLYILHCLFKHTFPVSWRPEEQTHGAYLFMNLWSTIFWLCFSIFLYKNNVFISI